MPAASLAKLTRPRLHGAVPRPRLYALLDDAAASRPIVWVGGGPGYGKTTLVAAWLEARRRRHLWYQVDPGDAEAATFAHYMQLAVQPFVRRRGRQALFPPQPQQDLASYVRSLFRDLFALLPAGCVVVLDNFHDAHTTPELRAALAAGLDEMPHDRTLVIVSRGEPPPELARLAAAQRIARLDPAALACTADESLAILAGSGDRADAARLAQVQQAAGGWPAALVLWREHLRAGAAAAPDEGAMAAGRDAVFAYFAGEVLARAAPADRLCLMRCAVAPSITADEARALAGDGAPRLLESLFRRRLFVDRRPGPPATYHFHALFREFLLGQAAQRVAPADWRALSGRAAGLLAARGAVDDALALARDAQDWGTVRTLVLAQAQAWARQGRAEVLSGWIDALPASLRDADPWLVYWQGCAWTFVQPRRGRALLEQAFDAFCAAGDRRGRALAAATVVTASYYEWADFRPLDRWLPELDRLVADAAALDAATALRVHAARLIALLFRHADEAALRDCAARLDALLDAEPDLSVRVMAASILFNYLNWMRPPADAVDLVARTQPVLQDAAVGPLMQLWWRTHLSFWCLLQGRPDESARVADEARAIAERYGLTGYLFEIDHARADALINGADPAAASALLDGMETRLAPARRMDFAYFHHLRSSLRQRLGQARLALDDAERALHLAQETGMPEQQVPHFIARVGMTRAGVGDFDGALAAMDAAVQRAGGAHERRSLGRLRDVVAVEAELASGDLETAAARLASVMRAYRERGARGLLGQRPDAAARLLAFALQRGIETDWALAAIAHRRLPAPPGAGPTWPYRLRIQVLGGFSLVRDGQPLRFAGKAQQRPLDLLKLLVALGGRDVRPEVLTDALWPDADGAAAKSSFDSTLFRLRKLLDVDDVLVLAAGQLSLARALAWSDLDELELALDALPPPGAATPALQQAAQRLFAAWRGPLLGTEAQPWLLRPRDALRARTVHAVLQLGQRLEQAGDPAAAAALYRRGLEADDLAESLHRALMRALVAAGQPAEALAAYRRCRELLVRVLGVAPAPETQALHDTIVAAGLARS